MTRFYLLGLSRVYVYIYICIHIYLLCLYFVGIIHASTRKHTYIHVYMCFIFIYRDNVFLYSLLITSKPKADDAALVPFKTPAEVFLVDPSWTSKLVWDIYVMSAAKMLRFGLTCATSHLLASFWLTGLWF